MNKTYQLGEASSCIYPACEFCKDCGDDEDD